MATRLRHTVMGIPVVLALAMVVLAAVDDTAITAGAILVLWGLG